MSKVLKRKMKVAKIILAQLQKEDTRWTELYKITLVQSGTPWMFQNMMRWLLKEGYIERIERGLYHITDKGSAFLELL